PSFTAPFCFVDQLDKKRPPGGDGIIVAFNGERAMGKPRSIDVDSKLVCVSGRILLKPTPASLDSTALVNTHSTACNDGTNYIFSSYDEHPGYDFRAMPRTPVFAVADGTVIKNGSEMCVRTNIKSCSHFNYIGIDHGNGYITQYGHLDDNFLVKA